MNRYISSGIVAIANATLLVRVRFESAGDFWRERSRHEQEVQHAYLARVCS
ncbi:MAG: hypothetical protein ABI645_02100 [Pseudomonadota bacterium]